MTRFMSVVLVVFSLSLGGCCSCHEAESAVRDVIAANEGHMNDKKLPVEARSIAEVNYDFGWKILYGMAAIKESEIPEAVRARISPKTGGE